MGNSLKDALKAVMGTVGKVVSSMKKGEKNRHEENQTPAEEDHPQILRCSEEEIEEQGFANIMADVGIEKAKFTNTREPSRRHITPVCQQPSRNTSPRVTKHIVTPIPPKAPLKKKSPPSNPIKRKTQQSVQRKAPSLPKEKLQPPKPLKKKQAPSASAIVKDPGYKISFKEPISPHPKLINISQPKQKKHLIFKDATEQLAGSENDIISELVIGLDFGTSSVKVVIGDKDRKIAFAIPFFDEIGLSSFLLPSRVWHSSKGYSFAEKGEAIRDLKLQLVKRSCPVETFLHTTAFLALVIRHARNWLLSEQADTYRQTHIYWSLALGIPAESYDDKSLVDKFKKLARAAWLLSREKEEFFSDQQVERVCSVLSESSLEDIEISVVPELTAQIYGFLNSTKFDPDGENIFMIVDVGAGTVDSSIFHARKGIGRKFEFEYYSNYVEFNGVTNLHAKRMEWLNTVLQAEKIPITIRQTVERVEVPTDFLDGIPESINEYFTGLDFTFTADSPDGSFFQGVKLQVLNKTLKETRSYVASDYQFKGMPLFLCGGGSRMKFYKQLEDDLLSHPNASWFKFEPSQLEIPESLSAPGVAQHDFDRLSVAFGLSFLDLGNFARGRLEAAISATQTGPTCCPWCGSATGCYCK